MTSTPYDDLDARRQRALDEAAAWLERLREASPTATQRGAFADWLRESPLHVAAMLRIAHIDQTLSAFDGWKDVPEGTPPFNDTLIPWPSETGRSRTPESHDSPRSRRWMWSGVGACVGLIVACLLWWSGAIGGAVYGTGVGERRDVALQDGSTLRLGPNTRLRVKFSDHDRDIWLERGEAVFKVAKDPSRPFVVCAERARVRAVGTEFGVEERTDSTVVTVAEGRVTVSQEAPGILRFFPSDHENSRVAVGAGEQIAVLPSGGASGIRPVDSRSSLAWSNGRLVFDNDPISFAVERFNQYNRVQLVVEPPLASRRISGSFDATDLDSFVTFLGSAVQRVSVRREGTQIIISKDVKAAVQPQ